MPPRTYRNAVSIDVGKDGDGVYLDVATVDGDSYVNAYKHVRIGKDGALQVDGAIAGTEPEQPTPRKRAPKKGRRVVMWRGADVPHTFSVIGSGVAEYEYVLDAAPATYRRDGDAHLLAPLEHAYERAYANTLAWFARAHERVYGTARGTTLSWEQRRVFLRPDRRAKCVHLVYQVHSSTAKHVLEERDDDDDDDDDRYDARAQLF